VEAGDLIAVFRAPRRRECDERLLVLTAVGIEGQVLLGEGTFLLQVAAADAPAALRQLQQYERENRPLAAAPPAARPYSYAWLGCLIYALVLLAVPWLLAHGHLRLDAFDLGELDAAAVQAGQWWRAWTALTLHVDAAHLVANLGAGLWFGYLAARQLGPGSAWLLTVMGAALANLIEGLAGPPAHHSVGASTAVFTALGAMAAYSWHERFPLPQRWARRWGPLIAGIILLGWTGSAGEQTDLMAHLLGFAVGALLGALAALPALRSRLARVPQWLAGAAALLTLVVAWACALRA
jgi:rhomboid protease GluP